MNVRAALELARSLDGRDELVYAASARLAGVSARVLGWRRKSVARRQRLVAVTGTYGKTTTVRALRAALGLPAERHPGRNANNGLPLAFNLLRQSPFRAHAVVEIGINGPGQMGRRMRAYRPDVVVVTSLGTEHRRAFRSADHQAREKAKAVASLPTCGLAVLNADDAPVLAMREKTRARVVTFALNEAAGYRAEQVTTDWPRGSRFIVAHAARRTPVRTGLLGEHGVRAALAAFAAAVELGVAPDVAGSRLAGVRPVAGRARVLGLPSGAQVIADDFKGSFETVMGGLDLLAQAPAERRIVVLGGLDAPPSPQRGYYRAVGERAAEVADRIIIIERWADQGYLSAIRARAFPPHALTTVKTFEEVVAALQGELGPGDVVLIEGRSEERLARVYLALGGRRVTCEVRACRLRQQECYNCPLLSKRAER